MTDPVCLASSSSPPPAADLLGSSEADGKCGVGVDKQLHMAWKR